jgi:putative Holliday junction resolvase
MAVIELSALRSSLSAGQRLLGIDLGEKTIGLALSDTRLTVATPLDTLRRSKFTTDADKIVSLISQHDVGALIVGLPRNMDGSEGPATQSARAFARNFALRSACPVALWDERLSTAAATRALIAADASRAKRAQVVDKVAAAYILQGALDWLRFNPDVEAPA